MVDLRRVCAGLLIAALCGSCATTRLPPVSSAGAAFKPERDEARLWQQARAEETKLLESVRVYQDPLLADYLAGVVVRLNPPGMAANPQIAYRVTVLEDPTLNAFAFPTGSLYLHTGILARMENESQLATVLGHEMSHVEGRHLLRHQRSLRNKQIALIGASVVGAAVLAGEEGRAVSQGKYGKAARTRVLSDVLLGLGLQLAFVAAVNGYGRDLEREADEGGFAKLGAAGYDPREAPKVYQALLSDHGDSRKAEAFFFGSHPRLTERIAAANRFATTQPGPASPAPGDEFARRMRPVIRDDARLNLALGRLDLAEHQLGRVLALMPADPEAHHLSGLLQLQRADAASDPGVRRERRVAAAAAFREAIRIDPNRADPHREVGLLAYGDGDHAAACAEFRQYLELAPQAADAQRIRDYELELRADGRCR